MDSKMSADEKYVYSPSFMNFDFPDMYFPLTPTQNGEQGLLDYSADLDSASLSRTGSTGSPGRFVGASTTSNTLAQENSIVSGSNNTSCAHGATNTTNNDPLSIMHMLHARGTSFKCNGTGQIIIDTGIGGGGLHEYHDGASQLATTTSSHPTIVSSVSSGGSTFGTTTSPSPSLTPPPQKQPPKQLHLLTLQKPVDFSNATFCVISFEEGCGGYSIDPRDKKLLEMNLLIVGVQYRNFPESAVRACCPFCREAGPGNYYTGWLITPGSLDKMIGKLRDMFTHMGNCPNRKGAPLQVIGKYSFNTSEFPKINIVKLLEKNNFANVTKDTPTSGGGTVGDQSEGKYTFI